jgi:hypothetical protein
MGIHVQTSMFVVALPKQPRKVTNLLLPVMFSTMTLAFCNREQKFTFLGSLGKVTMLFIAALPKQPG